MKTNVVFTAFLMKEGRKKFLVAESFSTNGDEAYKEKMDIVNEKVNDSIKELTGNSCLFAKEKINDITGGNSVIYVDLESPNFGDYLFAAKCCNGDEVVESQKEVSHKQFKDYNEFNDNVSNSSRVVTSKIFEKMSENMFKNLRLDKGFELEVKISKSKEELDLDDNYILIYSRVEFEEEC